MARIGEWSKLRNQDSYSSLPEKNSPDSLSMDRCSSRSHRCEWKNGPDDSVYIMILFLCKLISDDMIAMETVCLWTVDVCYCGGCVPLIVIACH
jgi:hypothetical protein